MSRFALVAVIVGCASQAPAPTTPVEPRAAATRSPAAQPPAPVGGQGYGGQGYGGQRYGGHGYGGQGYGGQSYGGHLHEVSGVPGGGLGVGAPRLDPGLGDGTSGYGLRGRHPTTPLVTFGPTTAGDGLDPAIIRRYLKRNMPRIRYCYEKQLAVNAKLAGTVTMTFAIAPSGVVTSATVTGVDPNVSACLAGVVKQIEFPKPKDDRTVQVSSPITFKPAGG